ncbi:MAG TPA: hypothetical protein VK789_00785 [Bryobacteraceae bacterium]|nr:hypothetical protein [Bryobacteraceae bacterium]
MRKTLCVLPFCAVVLFAQGPRGGGPGPGGFGGFGGRGPGILGAGTRTPITGAPYSATETLTTEQALVGNQISRKQTATVARDSQGRISTSETVTPATSSGKSPYTIETIFDPVAGYRYELNSATMIAIQTPLPKPRNGNLPAGTPPARPPNPNVTTTSLGTQTINGVTATGTQRTETIPAGAIGNAQPIQVTRVAWVSTDLKVPVQIKSSDPRFGASDLEVTNIVEGEPGASLFVVPAGYTVQQGGRGPGGPDRKARRGPGGPQ